jgi:hypothetical protein
MPFEHTFIKFNFGPVSHSLNFGPVSHSARITNQVEDQVKDLIREFIGRIPGINSYKFPPRHKSIQIGTHATLLSWRKLER